MIQAKEYKIGNWIVDWETEEKYFQIEEIRKHVGYDVWAYYRNGSIKCKEPEPIELSEEILLKCDINKWINQFEVRKNLNNTISIYAWKSGVSIFICHLDFLHEFQNWYYFNIKEELTVNL